MRGAVRSTATSALLRGRDVEQLLLLRSGDATGTTSRLPAILPEQLPGELARAWADT